LYSDKEGYDILLLEVGRMSVEETFACFVGAYYGICEMDEYLLKEYVLYDIECYVKNFVLQNPMSGDFYTKKSEDVLQNTSLKTKLQDALLVLPKVNAPLDLILLVKARLRQL